MRRAADYVSRRPFLPLAAGLVLGVALSDRLDANPWIGLAAAVIALGGVILLHRRILTVVVLAWFGAQLGFARHELFERVPDRDVGRLSLSGAEAEITGRIVEPVRLYRDPERPVDDLEERRDDLVRGSFTVESDAIRAGETLSTGRVLVQFYRGEVDFRLGATVHLTGKLRTPRTQTNPGGYDRRKALRRRGIGAVLSVSPGNVMEQTAAPARNWMSVTESIRGSIRDRIYAHARRDAAAFLSALVLGYREDMPEALVSNLQRSGTAHFLAISGQNLVILVGVLYAILYFAGLRGARLNLVLIVLLTIYAALTGWPVSVVRAFLMTLAVLLAAVLWRRSDTVNSLSAAAAAILLVDPVQLFDPGFQLSFLAVLGIIAITPVFHDWLAVPEGKPLAWAVNLVRGALSVSMAAWITTAPIVLANFNLCTPIILVANLLLLPLMFIEMILGLLLIPLAYVAPPAATAVGSLAAWTLDLTGGVAGLLTSLPGSWLYLPALAPGPVLAYYGLLGVWTAWVRRWPSAWKPWTVALFAAMLALPALRPHRPQLQETTMLDVGRGSAQAVCFPDGRVIVFDCGSISARDAGASVMAPFLWTLGLTKIDVIFLSHPDADHVNGVKSLVQRFRVGSVAVSRYFDRTEDGAALLAWLRGRKVRIEIVGRDGAEPDEVAPGLTVFGPPGWEKYGAIPRPPNESSLVLRAGDVLFTGDIEELGTEELLTLKDDLKTRVFVVPHHAKMQKCHAELLEAVAPDVALVSAPDTQPPYFAPAVVNTLSQRTGKVYITGRDGAVTIISPK